MPEPKTEALEKLKSRLGTEEFDRRWNLGYRGAQLYRWNLDLLDTPTTSGEQHASNRQKIVEALSGACIASGYTSDMAAQLTFGNWQLVGKSLGFDKVSQNTIDHVVKDLFNIEGWKDRKLGKAANTDEGSINY